MHITHGDYLQLIAEMIRFVDKFEGSESYLIILGNFVVACLDEGLEIVEIRISESVAPPKMRLLPLCHQKLQCIETCDSRG